MVIIFLAVSIVALKGILEPFASVFLSVISSSIIEFVSSVPLLSFRLTASLNVSVISESIATPVCVFVGLHS